MSSMPGNSTSNPLKSGKLDVCVKGILSKSWVTKQCYLCPALGDQPAKIEAYDVEDNSEKSRKVWKVFCLRGLKKATAKHKSGENHLDIVTKKEKYCFSSANELEIKEWEQYLQGLIRSPVNSHHEAEIEDSVSGGSSDIHENYYTPEADMQVLFDDNILYESADPQMQFEVSIDPNADSSRLNLSGSFYLVINDFTLALMDKYVRRPVCIWPYKCIRRYGKTPEKFSIEVGRKSTTGPGNFCFLTDQGMTIFRLAHAKLERMRQTEMVTRENILQQEVTHENKEFEIPRSASVECKETLKLDRSAAERKSYPGHRHPPHVLVDSNRNISSQAEEEHEKGSHGKHSKKDKTKDKKAGKAEKAKQKEEKKKNKIHSSKKHDEAKSAKSTSEAESLSEKGHMPDHVIGPQVLPPLDPNAASRLKHVAPGEDRKAQPAPVKPCPPSSAAKPDHKGTTKGLKGSKSPTPEELYSLPHGVNNLQPFPQPAVATRALRHYEDPDLPNTFHGASANIDTEVENCYDEVEPKDITRIPKGPNPKDTAHRNVVNGKGITKQKANLKNKKEPNVTLLAYSEVENRTKAWQELGVAKEDHVEHYSGVKTTEDEEELYETTEIPQPSHNFPPPITSRDLESDEFVDNNYDHLLVPSTKLKVVIKHDEDVDTGAYSTTSVTNQPTVNINYTGHEYEEAVVLTP